MSYWDHLHTCRDARPRPLRPGRSRSLKERPERSGAPAGRRPPPGSAWAPGGAGRGAVAGLAGHRNREGEPRALAGPAALGPDAAPVGLHQPLADGQAQAGPPDPALGFLAPDSGVLSEQVRQQVSRHA